MNKRAAKKGVTAAAKSSLNDLVGRLRALIQDARHQALRTVDVVQVGRVGR